MAYRSLDKLDRKILGLIAEDARIDPEKIGYETCAYIGLYLKNPEDFDRVVEALKKIPEVVECHITTGDYDLFIKIFARNNHHMMDIIHDKLQPLGLSRSKSLISSNKGQQEMIRLAFVLLLHRRGLFVSRGPTH